MQRSNKSITRIFSKLPMKTSLIVLFLISVFLGTSFTHALQSKPSSSSKPSISQEAQKIDDECMHSDDKDHCYGNAIYQVTKKSDSKHAVKVLTDLQRINPQNTSGCHFMAHKISLAEVEKNPDQWKEIISQVSPSNCTGGYLHGVLEAHMATDPNFHIDEQTFIDICDYVFSTHKTWFAWRGCVHNLGHLVLVETEGNIQDAVTVCDKISDSETKYECLSGTFMERVTAENLTAHGLVRRPESWDEPLAKSTEELCDMYEGMHARACWKVISYVYFATANHDPIGLYDKCKRAPTEEMQDECFIYGAGNMVVTTRFKQDNLRSVCHQFPVEHPLFKRCMNQILGSLLTSTTDNLNKTQSLCSKTYEIYKRTCYKNIVNILNQNKTSANIIQVACSAVPDNLMPDNCVKISLDTQQ